jgi:mannose-6-phosphate isomerase-like protein (cupin superfamily)
MQGSNGEFARYPFGGRTGYVLSPSQAGHEMVSFRHSAQVDPWCDSDLHMHTESEEHYLVLQGELSILVGGSAVTIKPDEILTVKPNVPHAVLGGSGPIEHFVIRAPSSSDRQPLCELPQEMPPVEGDSERELRREWGYRIPLQDPVNQNCWLIGFGSARFTSRHLILAFIDFLTQEAANAGIGIRHRLHLHRESWEYYVVLRGSISLQIEEDLLTIPAGEILEVPPGVRHTLKGRQSPYRGMTVRVPIPDYDDKVEF